MIVGVVASSAQREVRFAGGVCVWERNDNPATLHSPVITTTTTQQNIQSGSWIRQGKMIQSKRVVTHGLRFTIPPLYPYENHASSQFSCSEHSQLGYLIKMHSSYMMPQLNMYAAYPDRPSVIVQSLKHNTTESMVGIFPSTRHHDSLQYIHHIH